MRVGEERRGEEGQRGRGAKRGAKSAPVRRKVDCEDVLDVPVEDHASLARPQIPHTTNRIKTTARDQNQPVSFLSLLLPPRKTHPVQTKLPSPWNAMLYTSLL